MVHADGHPRKRRNTSHANFVAGSGRGIISVPNASEIQITETAPIETEQEIEVCQEVSKEQISEEDTPTDEIFYILVRSIDISEVIISNLCSKEHVSYGFSTMLNEFSNMIDKKFS